MSVAFHKVVRDFWQERARAVLVVLAVALGIAGFDSVLSSYAILTRELDKGYLATNPASAVIRTERIDDDLLSAIVANPEVSDAEPRRVFSARIKSGPVQWRNAILFVVKDYGNIRVSTLVPEEGAWPPATGEILIERDAFQVANTHIGEFVTVRTSNGAERTLRVSGRVHDVGQAQARMENLVYGYITADTLAQLGEDPYLDQLNILVAHDRFNEEHIRAVASDVRALIESRGRTVRRVDIPQPGKHPHSDLMAMLLLIMSSFGLFVLVLSGILVINLLTALMAAQVRQIGVMKAIGGTRKQIARIYFAQALLLGAAATVVAIPLGLLGGRALCRYMAVFLNFDITSFAVPDWVYLLVILIGIIAPLMAAALPVWRGTSVPARVALQQFGVSRSNFGVSSFDTKLAGMGGAFRPLMLALRNSFRRRQRMALTIITLAAGGLFFMAALNVRGSMMNTLDRLFAARKFDVSVSLSAPYSIEKLDRAVKQTRGVRISEYWFTMDGSFMKNAPASTPAEHGGRAGAGLHGSTIPAEDHFPVIALSPETRLLQFNIIAGRALSLADTDAIVFNNALAAKGPKVGDVINLRLGPADTSWRIVGVTREPFSPSVAYVPLSFVDSRHPGMANSIRLALDNTDSASIDAVKAALDQNLQREEIKTAGSATKSDSRYAFDQHMLMIYVFLIVMAAVLALVGGLGLTTTMTLNVLERRREMGILRAIGATPRMVWLIVVLEGLMIGFVSWAIAALGAWPLSKLTGDAIGGLLLKSRMDSVFDISGLLTWFAISVGLSVVASIVPAWRASRTTVREALAYE